jgi:archaellum component FlaG (FlaF/FlaG flagellin family)
MCQRYFERYNGIWGVGRATSTTSANVQVAFKVSKRISPNLVQSPTNFINVAAGNKTVTTWAISDTGTETVTVDATGVATIVNGEVCYAFTNGYTGFDAEL